MNTIATQMGAIIAAMRMLLAQHQRSKPDDLMIVASTGLSSDLIESMMSHAADKRSTFLALFHVEDDTALLDKVMIIDATTKKTEINIGGGKFVQKADGSCAILSINREEPYEYAFARSGRRLVRRSTEEIPDRAMIELRGLKTLLAKAASPECQREAVQLMQIS